jgi:uncharacterized protein (TIGR02996 family)
VHDENDFLRALLVSPADDTLRMIYADWLDERGDDESKAKAQFLRVTVRLMGPITRVGWRHARRMELHELALELPGEWLAVVSRLRVENCANCLEAARKADVDELARHGILFNLVCDKRWDELTATDHPTVRHCDACQKSVYFCDNVEAARKHVRQGHCVAVSLGVIYSGDDLRRPGTVVGGGGII